jgi:uncharacterized protein (DUF1778 family)
MAVLSFLQATDNEQLHLSPLEQQRFAEMLLNSPDPSEKLKQAMKSYFKNVEAR